MGLVTQLEVVNSCRAVMGMAPLPTLAGYDDPNIDAMLQALVEINRREQSRKWWFNLSFPTLSPDTITKEITIPSNVIEIDSMVNGLPAVQRGNRLYNPLTGSFQWDNPLPVYIVEILTFEDCPTTFQELVRLKVVEQWQRDFDADPQKMAKIAQQIIDTGIIVNAQHTRSIDPNFLEEGTVSTKLYAIRYPGQSGRWDTVKRSRRF